VRQYLDENDTIGTIRLEVGHPAESKTVWILLEGDSDLRLYRKLIDGNNAEVRQVYYSGSSGLTALKKALKVLREDDQIDRVIGIRDADFLHLNDEEENTSCLFITDYHDIEMMTIASDSTFEAVVAEYCGNRLHDYPELRDSILKSIRFIGGIRWYNDKHSCGYNFKGLGFGKYYDSEELELKQQECVDDINERSPGKTGDAEVAAVNGMIATVDDLLNLCNGHDFTKAFALFVTANYVQVPYKNIESGFRLAYDSAEFERTLLYESLKDWETRSTYSIFSDSAS